MEVPMSNISGDKIEHLEKQISELTRLVKEKYTINQDYRLSNSKTELNYQNTNLEELRMELNELKNGRKNIEDNNEKLKRIISKIEDKSNEKTLEIDKLKEELLIYKIAIGEKESKIVGYQEKLKELNKRINSENSSEEKLTKLTKQISELKSENSSIIDKNNKLKELLEKNKKDYPERIKNLNETISSLNDQVSVLKREKKFIDETNVRLLSEIDFLQADIKKLSNQIEAKETEIQQVRKILSDEKNISEEKLMKRLKDFAHRETRKHVLLMVKIKELLDLVTKQREVIENINQADINLYDLMNNTINQIKESRNSIDYSIVEKKLEDMSLDIASVGDLIEMSEDKIAAAVEESTEAEITDEFALEDEEEKTKKRIGESVRRSLESGDSPELIEKSLIDKGEKEEIVKLIVEKEIKEQRMDL